MHPLALLLALLWIVPACLRVWRLARFFQIEEYMNGRFLRWVAEKRERLLAQRPALIMLGGIIASFALQVLALGSPLLHSLLWVSVAGLLCLPEPVKEVKKSFRRTPRATRLLGASFLLVGLFILGGSVFATRNMSANTPEELSTVALVGFLGLLLASLALVGGNLLMAPVEASQRAGFRRKAQARLAAAQPYVIGITGSYGKTSTKHFLAHILSGQASVYATPKSYNTEMGVSLAINQELDPDAGYRYFIAEMGAYVPGEIARIVELTHPQMSIVTTVGPMHLERFKSLENIVAAKYEIIAGLAPDGVAIFNGDNPQVREMWSRGYPDTRYLVSAQGDSSADLYAEDVQQTLDGIRFTLVHAASGTRQPFETALLGSHNISNILLASAAAYHLGLGLEAIAERVASLQAAEHRLQVNRLPNNIIIIDDAYSANPAGARSALEVLGLHPGRRIVITPGMVELGAIEEEENYRLAQDIAQVASEIVLVGQVQTQAMQRGIAATPFDPAHLHIFDTFQEAQAWFQAQLRAGDAVLFLNDLPDTYI